MQESMSQLNFESVFQVYFIYNFNMTFIYWISMDLSLSTLSQLMQESGAC